jgi:methylisocitrate lyase
MSPLSAGARLRAAVESERPLQLVGAVNAFSALLAERSGFKAIYLSGAGVANASLGVPDLGITSRNDVCEDVRRITSATELPLLVDADTGWGAAFNIARTTADLTKAGAAGCISRIRWPPSAAAIVRASNWSPAAEMVDRIRAAVDARTDRDLRRHGAYRCACGRRAGSGAAARIGLRAEAGADMIFAEALTSLEEYRQFTAAVRVPVLANITEFGKTPLFTRDELHAAGVRLVLYPLSAFRAAARASLEVYAAIRRDGTQASVLDRMQTRAELYDVLRYHDYERKLDELFGETS